MKNYYFIDWDNIGIKCFDFIKEDADYINIVGLQLGNFYINFDILNKMIKLANDDKINLKIHKCTLKNSSDFMICYLIGKIVGEEADIKNIKINIISDDKGFNSLEVFKDLNIEFIGTNVKKVSKKENKKENKKEGNFDINEELSNFIKSKYIFQSNKKVEDKKEDNVENVNKPNKDIDYEFINETLNKFKKRKREL